MIRYIIVDDEHIAHDIIKRYCDMLPNLELKKNCYDALEAFEYLSKNEVDLIFLDLNMPKLKGFDFLKTLRTQPNVIVTTAYKEYALEGYELNIIDYLLKPFSFERFLKAVNKSISTKSKLSPTNEVEEQRPPSRKIFLRGDNKYTQVDVNHILFIEASGNYSKVVLDTEMITVREKISTLLNTLPEGEFIQVHKSFAVAIDHISSIEGNRIFIDDHAIPIGKMYKLNVLELLK